MFFTDKPTLQGDLIVLRPFTEKDIDDMGVVLADPEVRRLTGSVRTTAGATGASVVLSPEVRQWYASLADRPDRLDLAIIDRSTGACVGEVVLNDLNEADASCNFRILIGAAGRDRGFGTEATRLVLDHAFHSTALNRVELEVFAFNPRAQHVYERAGFKVEGRLRQTFTFDDQRIDTIVMSVLRRDRSSSRARVRLVPLAANRFPAWLELSRREYETDLITAGEPADEARSSAEQTLHRIFPDHAPVHGHAVFDVVESAGGVVGYLWIGHGAGARDDSWWVWDVLIHPDERGKGFGRAALELAEEYARSRGARNLGLNVFGFNRAARGLYESLGYEVVALEMRKELSSD